MSTLTAAEVSDIRLWIGWGNVLGYPTDHKAYLKEALKPEYRPMFLTMPRDKRKAILRYLLAEPALRAAA